MSRRWVLKAIPSGRAQSACISEAQSRAQPAGTVFLAAHCGTRCAHVRVVASGPAGYRKMAGAIEAQRAVGSPRQRRQVL